MNFVAPALIKAELQAAMLKVMQHSLADVQNVAVFLSPLFSYKKNGRYNEEKAVLQRVSMTGAQMDRVFSLIFDDKLDLLLAITQKPNTAHNLQSVRLLLRFY